MAIANGITWYDDSNMLFDTEVEMMRCKLSEITATDDMLEQKIKEKKYAEELKVKKSVRNKLKEVYRSNRYFYNLMICAWLWLTTFMIYNTFNVYSTHH